MKIATDGLDLATPIPGSRIGFAGTYRRTQQLRRADVLPFFAKPEPRVVGMEA
jgi:hypothetical protein